MRPLSAAERRADQRLRARFGITLEQYEKILEEQGGLCGICRRPPKEKRHAVDHNHKGGSIRGLLCEDCNYKLGMLHDDYAWMAAAALYLAGRYAEAIVKILGPDHRVQAKPYRAGKWRVP